MGFGVRVSNSVDWQTFARSMPALEVKYYETEFPDDHLLFEECEAPIDECSTATERTVAQRVLESFRPVEEAPPALIDHRRDELSFRKGQVEALQADGERLVQEGEEGGQGMPAPQWILPVGSCLPAMEGDFEKRSPWWYEGWRRRTYILKDRKLLYFKPDDLGLTAPLGVLDFDTVRYELHCLYESAEIGDTSSADPLAIFGLCEGLFSCDQWGGVRDDRIVLRLKPTAFPKKCFEFRGSARVMQRLVHATGLHIRCAAPLPYAERGIVAEKNFWRFNRISESKYLSLVQTGDILLFRGTDGGARVTRTLTASEYDHVALLLRVDNGSVLIFEATGNHGVTAVSWSDFKAFGWHKCYTKLVYRKVYFKRHPRLLASFQDFIFDVLGKPYRLTVRKLLWRHRSEEIDVDHEEGEVTIKSPAPTAAAAAASSGPRLATAGDGYQEASTQTGGGERRDQHFSVGWRQGDDEQTYFCSELVAKCLKRLGVLRGSRAASQYWPGTFSVKTHSPLPLSDGCAIGEELIIAFDLP
ncbi:unnamed protein product [Vitrella brassicaformis CCMP3155]|uniref:PH domain-containing protein n=1 Tax=Vitrella brassicaformis (strain CCMP3155) TaxID=1169540 RepID=A0A0G4EMB2_VITBC|nr:unnamed protein product [Vitrella brassicaformis CCMP3155]|eukprot:CEL98304.1 unnamed protein product [Vitrella brassicaformis CCMP3155]